MPRALVTTSPSSLVARSVAYNAVTLGWTDTSSNESGFKVERSNDGVAFTEIATLGAGTVSFSDGTVAASRAYFYRVRAYNSVGGSAYSNTLSVRTSDVPPAAPGAPSSIAASNNADGSATVGWGLASGTVTYYEVRRSAWDSRKAAWGATALVATVPASISSLVDSAGAGSYQYTVRATNSGGASAYAGPAQVTVTAPTSSKRKNRRN